MSEVETRLMALTKTWKGGEVLVSKYASEIGLEGSEWMLLGFGILLLIGIVGENRLPSWSTRLKWYHLAVLVGVVGELLGDGGIFLFSSHLQTLSDIEVARVGERASKADERASANEKEAALARKDAESARTLAKGYEAQIAESRAMAKNAEALVSSAKEQAAKAESETAKAQLELAKIQERMADRTLTDRQAKEISDALRAFAGQEFEVTTYEDSREPLAISNRISSSLSPSIAKALPRFKTAVAHSSGVCSLVRTPRASRKVSIASVRQRAAPSFLF